MPSVAGLFAVPASKCPSCGVLSSFSARKDLKILVVHSLVTGCQQSYAQLGVQRTGLCKREGYDSEKTLTAKKQTNDAPTSEKAPSKRTRKGVPSRLSLLTGLANVTGLGRKSRKTAQSASEKAVSGQQPTAAGEDMTSVVTDPVVATEKRVTKRRAFGTAPRVRKRSKASNAATAEAAATLDPASQGDLFEDAKGLSSSSRRRMLHPQSRQRRMRNFSK